MTHVKEKKSVERDEHMILTLELAKPKKSYTVTIINMLKTTNQTGQLVNR